MAGLSWLRAGTIMVTNGSRAVTGTDTIWSGGVVNPGDMIQLPNGSLGEVEAISSNTSLTLKLAYTGATASAQPYAIIRMLPSGNVAADLAADLQALIQRYGITLDQLVDLLDSTGAVSFSDGTTTLQGLHGLRKLMADISGLGLLAQQHRADAVARLGGLEAWRAGYSGDPPGGGTYAAADGSYGERWFKVCGANAAGATSAIDYFIHISSDENDSSWTSTYIMTVLCSWQSGPFALEGIHVRKLSGLGRDLFGHDGKDVYIRRAGLWEGGIFVRRLHAHGVGLTEYKTNLADGDDYPSSFSVAVTDAYSKGS